MTDMLYSFMIRRAVPDDAPAVYSILQTAFREYGEITGLKKLDALDETTDDIRDAIDSKAVYIALLGDDKAGIAPDTATASAPGEASHNTPAASAGPAAGSAPDAKPGIAAGTAVGTLRLDIRGKEAYLSRFAVDRNHRNMGIGKALMGVADQYLIKKGVKKVTLHTSSRYGALMRFYYSRGFFVEAIETDRGYLRARMVKEYKQKATENQIKNMSYTS